MTIIIYLIGYPGTGKYTIGQELVQKNYIMCDNHLVNNPIFALLNYDGFMSIPGHAWQAIRHIRDIVFDFIAQDTTNNYVFTNVLNENAGDRTLFEKVEKIALKRSSLFIPVKLLISEEENKKRVQTLARKARYKSSYIDRDLPLINIIHSYLLELDITNLTPQEAAATILAHIENITIS